MKLNRLIFILIMAIPLVNAQGMENMLDTAPISRGMTLFFMCAAILIVFPFVNKQIKSVMIIPFVIILARGLIRIAEQDEVKAFGSIMPGLRPGIYIAVALVAVSAVIFIPVFLLRKIHVIKPEIDDSLEDYFKEGIKRGHDVESLKKALYMQGVSKSEVDEAAQTAIKTPVLKKITESVKGSTEKSIKDYLEKGLKKGYSLNSLKMNLIKKGADRKMVENEAKSFEDKDHYLEDHIRKGIEKGFNEETLKSTLLKQGVNSKEIDKAMKKVKK